MSVSLNKGDRVELSKDSRVNAVSVCLGWDTAKYDDDGDFDTVTFASFSTTFERFTFSPFVKLTAIFVSSFYNPYPLQSAVKPPA